MVFLGIACEPPQGAGGGYEYWNYRDGRYSATHLLAQRGQAVKAQPSAALIFCDIQPQQTGLCQRLPESSVEVFLLLLNELELINVSKIAQDLLGKLLSALLFFRNSEIHGLVLLACAGHPQPCHCDNVSLHFVGAATESENGTHPPSKLDLPPEHGSGRVGGNGACLSHDLQ